MPFDGVALRAMAQELNMLISGRIDKVQQPERDEIILTVRNRFESHRLLLCASPRFARAHITQTNPPVPKNAPMFCMLLRKRLISGRVLDVRTHGMDRILEIDISALDELGLESFYTLRCECMGRHSNIILCTADGTIVDAIKRVDEDKSRAREVLPGLRYEYPPAQDKCDASTTPPQALAAAIAQLEGLLSQRLAAAAEGFSTPTAQQFVQASGVDPGDAAGETLERLAAFTHNALNGPLSPAVLLKDGAPADFTAYASDAFTQARPCGTLSEAVETVLSARAAQERKEQKTAALLQSVNTALARVRRKAEKQQADLDTADSMEEYRIKAELLTANLYALQGPMDKAMVQNYYDPEDGMLEIAMDPSLSPQQNAQAYYKKYNKSKLTRERLQEHYQQTLEELDYLATQAYLIESAAEDGELDEIRDELQSQGYIRQSRQGARAQAAPSKPVHYRSSDGFSIYVGRNNAQNDLLTLRMARPQDIWLHVKNAPGSHVIIRTDGKPVPERTLLEAALVAAQYSRNKNSSSVAVDYTEKRNVKKPNGARPGYVIYLTNRTIHVTPGERPLPALA